MKSILPYLILSSVFINHSLIGQTIQGKVQTDDKQPVSYANVILTKPDSTLAKTGITDNYGKFELKNIPFGNYSLQISSLGFETLVRKLVITESTTDLGVLLFRPLAENLSEVTITARKPLIEVEPDKTVFNVSSSLTSSGNNTLEILRTAPSVRVDNNDNIIVEGKNGVLIYIDDRQSYLQGDDLTAFLQSLQADEIESIEIITQPSSRYDAAGNAGIINIRLKREKGLGTKGNVANTLTYGDYFRNNVQLSLTSKTKKWNLSGNYNNFTGRSTGFINLFRIQGDKIFDARTTSENDNRNHSFRTSADYTINDKNTLGLSADLSLRDNESRANSRTPIISRNTSSIDSILLAPNENESNTFNFNTNLNYRYKDTLGKVLTADLNYGSFERDRFNNQPNFYISEEGEVLNENITAQNTPIDILIYVGKVDYEQKLGKATLALGGKISFVNIDNTFEFFQVENGNPILDVDQSNNFIYDEQINAAYVNYNFGFKKFKVQLGLRMENTHSKGELTANNTSEDEIVERDYTDWFPSGGITYQPLKNHSLALNYSRRIQRPSYQALNPFEFQLDELSFRRGNPFLQPQYTNNIKLSHTYNYTLTTSISYSYISDFFAQVTEAEGENRNFINTRNVADEEIYNASVSYALKINSWWNIYISSYVSYNNYIPTNPAFIAIDQTTFGGYAQSTFSLSKQISFEVSGWYSSPSIWGGTYQTESLGALNLGIQKKWKRWTAKLSANDILYTIPWRGTTQFGDLFIDGNGGNDSRTFQIYVNYSFGNKDVKNRKNRKSGLEDEQNRIGS